MNDNVNMTVSSFFFFPEKQANCFIELTEISVRQYKMDNITRDVL